MSNFEENKPTTTTTTTMVVVEEKHEKTTSSTSEDSNTIIPDLNKKEHNVVEDIEKAQRSRPVSSDQYLMRGLELALVIIGLAFAIFLAALDQTIVATALPRIASDFNGLDQIAWVATSYLLTGTAAQATYGKFSDIFGRKATFLFTILVFELGSLLCGLSQNIIFLIIVRAVAGLGGGGILSLVMIIIADIVPLQDRGKYQGIIGACFGLASVAGPLLGGAFTDHVTWRWCFYINLPLGAITVAAVVFLLHLPKQKGGFREKIKRIDWWGTLVIVGATVALLLPLNWGGNKYAWDSPVIIVLLIVGGLGFILFGYIEGWIAVEPIAPSRLFKNYNVMGCFATNFFQGMAFFGMVYYVPLYFQVIKGESATASGLELIPFIMGVVLASISTGQTISRADVQKQYFAVAGGALITVGAGLVSLLDENSGRGPQIGYLLILGVGIGLIMQSTLLAAQSIVEVYDIAVVTSLLNFFRSIGAIFGVAIVGTIFSNKLSSNLNALTLPVPASAIEQSADVVAGLRPEDLRLQVIRAYVGALQLAFKLIIPIGALCFISALFIGKNKDQKRADEVVDVEVRAAAK